MFGTTAPAEERRVFQTQIKGPVTEPERRLKGAKVQNITLLSLGLEVPVS